MDVSTPLATNFLLYVCAVAGLVAFVLARSLSGRAKAMALGALATWFAYAAALGYSGLIGRMRPPIPGIFLLVAPIILFVTIVLVRSPAGRHVAVRIPLAVLVGLQAFRVGVELALHRLWEIGSVPKLMTLGGGNVDILIGLSALPIAWISTRGAGGRRVALVWNMIGLASLLNVAARAVMTAPGPLNFLQTEVPNVALGQFPFTFIPGFMAPLAMILHVLSLRALAVKARAGRETGDARVRA